MQYASDAPRYSRNLRKRRHMSVYTIPYTPEDERLISYAGLILEFGAVCGYHNIEP